MDQEIHYTWQFARHFGWLLRWWHQSGVFNYYVYVPIMTLLGVALYLWVRSRVRRRTSISRQNTFSRIFWQVIYFSISWLTVSSFGVAIKLMVVEELDYQERKWFEPYLSPGHLYLTTVCLAYLALLIRSKSSSYNLLLAAYLQIGLIVGYIVAGYRVLNEAVEGATGGALLLLFFAIINYDLFKQLRRTFALKTLAPPMTPESS